jgi:hypothetical protein
MPISKTKEVERIFIGFRAEFKLNDNVSDQGKNNGLRCIVHMVKILILGKPKLRNCYVFAIK